MGVMPLLIGSCLDIMKSIKEYNNGFIDEYIICTIIRDVLSGVQYIHNDGRVHRDIKSANILLSRDGVCQISDFGFSGAIIEGGLRKNGRHTFTGSLWWMSPEVLQRENKHSYKADIWSVGITSLELAFGKPPHSKQRPVKVMLTILQSAPPSIDSTNHEHSFTHKYSKKFKDFLTKCLQKDPHKRASAQNLLNHSFIKQAKDKQYLYDKILIHDTSKKYNNNILPYSVAQKRKKLEKKRNIKKNEEFGTNKNINSATIDSNCFDFNSEIHSISHSEKKEEPKEKEKGKEKPQNTEKLGRFNITVQNKQNNSQNNNDTTTTKGRFKIKKIT